MKANRLMNIRGIGFDLGETLIFYRDTPLNWAALYPDALRSVATACAPRVTEQQMEMATAVLSRYNTRITPRTCEVSAVTILGEVLQQWGVDAPDQRSVAVEAFFGFFQQNMAAYPDTNSALKSLRQHGIPVGILTDVPYGMPRDFVERDIERAGVAGLFNSLLTSVEVGVRKPEPAGYRMLADQLGIVPGEMMYVGNEPKDVIGALQAGAVAVFLDRSTAGGQYGQQFTIETLSQIHGIFVSLNS